MIIFFPEISPHSKVVGETESLKVSQPNLTSLTRARKNRKLLRVDGFS